MDFKISYTNKEITPWGGMVFLRKCLSQMQFTEAMDGCSDLPSPGSNRGYSARSIIESFLVSVWCGATRFMHTEITRHDAALCRIFGWKEAPAQDTFKRFFRKFTQGMNQRVGDYFYQWIFSNTRFDNYTLDCDSSILTRYGRQQGAKKGYNPHKPGRPSHHPLMAFVADVKLVANFWLRSGNTSSSEGFVAFLEDTLHKLKGKTVRLLRLDSGFYGKEVFEYLEKKSLQYIVAARFYEPIQQLIASQKTWLRIDQGVEVAELDYQSPLWQKHRRMILVRQLIKTRPKAAGKTLRLFADEEIYNQYRYTAYITNIALPGAEIWRLYRGRADSENRIKELKYDFGFDSFNLKQFFGTEAALIFTMLAYNIMSLFRMFILNSKTQHTLSTLRFRTFAIGAYFQKVKGHYILKLALNKQRRSWFEGLWNQSNQVDLPFQFSNA